jgi:undecaprenyl-diphosphatase
MPATLRDRFLTLRLLGRQEVLLLVVGLVVLGCAYVLIQLTDEVKEGDTQKFDEWVLRTLRRADDPALPIGPRWLREVGLDVTALGSAVVLGLVVVAVIGFMLLQRTYGLAWLTLIATTGGALLSTLLKLLIHRDRPSVVPHLREVRSLSFPSGHAMLSAVVYLTLGILLCRIVRGRVAKLYCLGWAVLLTLLVGMSRIYLGVHYPTDVLAGWMAGLVWALGCWLIAEYLRRRGAIEDEEGSPAPSETVDGAGDSLPSRVEG